MIHKGNLDRRHPFFSYVVDFSHFEDDNDITDIIEDNLDNKAVNEDYPAYFIMELPEHNPWPALSAYVVKDVNDVLRGRPELFNYLILRFKQEEDYSEETFGFDSFDPSSANEVNEYRENVDAAFINTIQSISPGDISAFLDFQLELFKRFPKRESVDNYFHYLVGLNNNIKQPIKNFVDHWLNENSPRKQRKKNRSINNKKFWAGSTQKLLKFRALLLDYSFIGPVDEKEFIKHFTGIPTTQKINWIESERNLIYLFDELSDLFNPSYINQKSDTVKSTEISLHFVVSNEEKSNILLNKVRNEIKYWSSNKHLEILQIKNKIS